MRRYMMRNIKNKNEHKRAKYANPHFFARFVNAKISTIYLIVTILAIIKKWPVLAWDPNYVNVTRAEAAQIKTAEASGYIADDKIDWNLIGQ